MSEWGVTSRLRNSEQPDELIALVSGRASPLLVASIRRQQTHIPLMDCGEKVREFVERMKESERDFNFKRAEIHIKAREFARKLCKQITI